MSSENLIRELSQNELNAELAQRAIITIQDLESKLSAMESSRGGSYYKVWSLTLLIISLFFLFWGEPDVFNVLRNKVMAL